MAVIKRKVKASTKKKLIAAAARSDRKQGRKDFQNFKKEAQRIERLFSREKAALEAVLQGKSWYEQLKSNLETNQAALLEADKRAKGDAKKLKRAHKKFIRSNTALLEAKQKNLRRAFRKVIDEKQIRKKILALMEAVTGPVYLAIFVAQIIGLNIAQKMKG
jgi:hypothetical protein